MKKEFLIKAIKYLPKSRDIGLIQETAISKNIVIDTLKKDKITRYLFDKKGKFHSEVTIEVEDTDSPNISV